MKIAVAIDSFKGSLSSIQAGNAVKEAAERLGHQAVVKPMADGGEGTVEALASGLASEKVIVSVVDPLGRPVDAVYCILKDTATAVIEMAAAAGLPLVTMGSFLGMICLYGFGTIWMMLQLEIHFTTALWMGVLPYLPADLIKITVAIIMGSKLQKRLRHTQKIVVGVRNLQHAQMLCLAL